MREPRSSSRPLKGGLCIGRKEGQDVQLDLPDGRVIVVTLTRLEGRGARLHIHAPLDVKILRGELVANDPQQQKPAA
jgi:sRNA-binding carbon storage regulator CsrA